MTLEDKADIFVDFIMGKNGYKSDTLRELLKEVYITAARQETDPITDWHGDIDDAPYYSDILIKFLVENKRRRYAVGFRSKKDDPNLHLYLPNNFCTKGELHFPQHLENARIIGWRKIALSETIL